MSLNEILKSTNEVVKIEGIIEDIDRINEENITAIQCKYHEEVEIFHWSKVSKPILQMLKTYTNSDGNKISFILYAFFPSEQLGEKAVSKNEINEMLNTKNIEYICDYIAHIKRIENPEIKRLVSKERKTKEERKKLGSISLPMSWKFCVILMIFLNFSIEEVYNYISNMNDEVISKIANEEQVPKIINDKKEQEAIRDRKRYFEKRYTFIPTSTAAASKASNGPFNGEFNRFISIKQMLLLLI